MSIGPAVGTATVRVIPDTTGFRALLIAQVNKATLGVTAKVQATVAGTAAAANAAALSGVGSGVGRSAASARGGVNALTKESQALRGSLIGLSRVTPVTVFGLGVYGTAAIAAGLAIKGAIAGFADFEHQLNVFQATSGASAGQMERVAAKAKELGADLSLPSTSAGDAALAMTQLSKAGLDVEDTLAGSTGVLQLAAAAQIDVGSAAEYVATQLNAFGLSGDQATHIADLLAGASVAAQGDIRDFALAMGQASAVARQVGLSAEVTTGAITELAKAGLRGSDGGTSLRTTLLRLAPTTKQAAEYMKALGIEIDKTRSIGEQLPELLDQYRASLSALNPVQQQQALTQIAGQDAIRALSILVRNGSEGLREATTEANRNGAANELATANAKGLSGAFNGLQSNLETLGITLGGFVAGPLESFIRGASDSVDGVVVLIEKIGDLDQKLKDAEDSFNEFFFKGIPGGDEKSKGVLGWLTDFATKSAKGSTFLGPNFLALIGKLKKEAEEATAKAAGRLLNPDLTPRRTPRGGRFPGGRDQGGQFVPVRTEAEKAAIRARIKALEEDKKRKKPLPADIVAPVKLQIAQNQAQLNENLQQELKADLNIERYFRERLKLAKEGSKRYLNIQSALAAAHATTAAIRSSIAAEAARAAAKADELAREQERIFRTNLSNRETRLRQAAEATNNQGAPEKALIAFYKQQSENAKLTTAEQLSYLDKYLVEIEKQKEAVVMAAKASIDLQNEILQTKLSAALLTDTKNDEIRVFRLQIKFYEDDIKRQKELARLAGKSSQARIDALIKIQKDLQEINSLKGQIKAAKDASSSSFSLNDLFQESINQFNEFASNVSGSVTTSGMVRGALGGAIATQNSKLTLADREKIQKAATTNDLLAQILNTLQGTDSTPHQGVHIRSADPSPGTANYARLAANLTG